MDIHKADLMEELAEVYDDVKQIEANLSRSIEIANFIIQKNKELILQNNSHHEQFELFDMERITMDQQQDILNNNIMHLEK